MRHNKRYLIFLLVALTGFLLITRIFRVKEITIVGNVLANEGSIRRIIGQPNLLWADLKLLEKKIGEDSMVKKATIEVIGVSSLRVVVEERKPVANIDLSGTLLQISSDGTILSVGDNANLPTIQGLAIFPFMPGQAIPQEHLYLLDLIEATRDLGLIEIKSTDGKVTLIMADNCEVYLGNNLEEPDIIRQKLKEITMRGQQHKYIDLSQKGYARGL
ncbi:MAG: FtsQ-type POTRA domain-containing protein [Firmicutes bacterium]|nr:FtsQ-type POTRA domain-containing protein [Bacillota bacterium]MDD4263094.1 FtsQ-type POTRA domain-containing protein [Bacillota bacterium]MDD4693433.1 FtsQ-type POTRA domain-containing protein [Bacillota bacterium]